MPNISAFFNKIRALKQDNTLKDEAKGEKILNIYYSEIKPNFSIEEIKRETQLLSDLVLAYRFAGKQEECAYEFLKNLQMKSDDFAAQYLIKNFAFTLSEFYRKFVEHIDRIYLLEKNSISDRVFSLDINKKDLDEILKKVIFTFERKNDLDRSLYSGLVINSLAAELHLQNMDANFALDLLEKVNFADLVKEPEIIAIEKGGRQHKIEFLSDYEKALALKAAFLYFARLFDELLKYSKEILNSEASYELKYYVLRKTALAKFKIGKIDEAIKDFENIALNKKDWIIYKEFGDILFWKKDLRQALKKYVDAALLTGFEKSKVDLYENLGDLLAEAGENPDYHYLYAAELKKSENQSADSVLSKVGGKYDNLEIEDIEKELMKFWTGLLEKGEIARINREKKFGFINCKNKDIFFHYGAYRGNPAKIYEGAKVSFSRDFAIDKSKNEKKFEVIYFFLDEDN